MTSEQLFIGGVGGVGVVSGWLVKHFSNGNGRAKEPSEVIVLLRQIAGNTAAWPEVSKEMRDYMIQGRRGMDTIERMDQRMDREERSP